MTPALGTLQLHPVSDRPDLLADPVRAGLNDLIGATACVAEIDPADADTASFSERYAVPLQVSANCVVALGRRAGEQRPVACVVLADTRVDVNTRVRKHLDVRRCSFAPQDYATEQSGMEYGGITPGGLPAEWPVLVDRRVAETEWIVVGSGLRRSKLAIPGIALASLPAAQILDDLGV